MIPGTASANLRPEPAATAAPYARHRGRSSSGMPTSSQMTPIGSGRVKCRIRSTAPSSAWPGSASSSSATRVPIRGRNASARRAVNAGDTSLRSRACSGAASSVMVRM